MLADPEDCRSKQPNVGRLTTRRSRVFSHVETGGNVSDSAQNFDGFFLRPTLKAFQFPDSMRLPLI
jgi:hypothetical protein